MYIFLKFYLLDSRGQQGRESVQPGRHSRRVGQLWQIPAGAAAAAGLQGLFPRHVQLQLRIHCGRGALQVRLHR